MEDKKHASYKEVKNLLHNDVGITKEEFLEIIRFEASKLVKEEVGRVLGKEGENIERNIYPAMKEVIEGYMVKAINNENYPKVLGGNMSFYGHGDSHKLENYVADVMKNEIADRLFDKFEVTLKVEEN